MPEITFETIKDYVGQPLGTSGWISIDQPKIDQFAACTGDRQWIHIDVDRAKRESPFRGTVAHGYLSLSLVAPLSMEMGFVPKGASAVFNYGSDKVRFVTPVRSGDRVRLHVSLLSVEPREAGQLLIKSKATLEIENNPSPALVAEILALAVP
jgi:acyl dehydratase